jgi:tetratricopeptide (TPR) repeat protein
VGDLEKAGECLRRIVELDPENLDAKHELTELLAGTKKWEALWPHAAELAEAIGRDPDASPEQRRETWLRAARCALEIGKSEEALKLMDRAVAIAPGNVSVVLERADALRRTGASEPAIKAYQSILVQHASALDASQRADAFRKLALIHKQLGHVAQSLSYYNKVLEVDAHHQETLKELTELHLARAEFEKAVASLRTLAETVAPDERAPILEQLGDLLHGKLRNPVRAAAAYGEALERDAANRRVLQKLLDLQSESGQWQGALDSIARFLELETDPRRRGKYLLAMAAIRREKTKDEPAALDDYERALHAFLDSGDALDEATRASALEAFWNLDELLVALKEWQRQDRAHRLMIKRLATGDPILLKLWHSLGEIQRTRLQQYESAVYAFETAHSLDPEKSPDRVRILAELYALVGKQAPAKATDHAARLVDSDPDNPAVYRAMGRACLEAGRLDETWCVSRALVYLKQATKEEQEFYERYQARERRKAKGVLDDEAWAHLRDDAEDRIVSSIFALTWEGPVALRAGPAKSFQLKSKEKLKVEDGSRAIGKIFQNAARVLNAPLPHVYVQPERSGRLLLANCIENGALSPTVIVGRDLMTGYRDTEIAFCVASMLALLRPAWYLRLALPEIAELQAALIASVGLVRKDVTVPAELAAMVASFSAEMQKRMTPQTAEVLRGLVGRLDERPNLVRWREAVNAAARRAGLLICGELEAAARMVSTGPALPDGPTAKDNVRDLVVFSVSPGYFAARQKLGVTVA